MNDQIDKGKAVKHIIDSVLAGVLVFLGALSTGSLDSNAVFTAVVASLIVAFTKFRDYWTTQEINGSYLFF